MGVELKRIYAKISKIKQSEYRKTYVKVSSNGAVLAINGKLEKVEGAVLNLYASQRDVIEFTKLDSTDLSKYHMIVVGSHDKKVPLADRFKKYVEEGGYLVTTGMCLENIVSDLFPEFLGFHKKVIKGGTFKGEISSPDNVLTKDTTNKKSLKYWVEEKSHPIKKISPNIKELVTSRKLEKKFGSGALVVAFNYGSGMVVHTLPHLHHPKANDSLNNANAYMLSNILDDSVTRAFPDEIKTPFDMHQMSYVNMVVLDDTSKKCNFCKSHFANYDGKVFKCGSCNTHYHEFCLNQQMAREGTCINCGKVLFFEKYKDALYDVYNRPQGVPQPQPTQRPESASSQTESKPEKTDSEPEKKEGDGPLPTE
jgi:hypothetical protein